MTDVARFTLDHVMLSRVAAIAERLGQWKQSNHPGLVPLRRRGNRIRTIQASLAIEQNSLSVEQVTAIIEGKPVLGMPREIQEVRNAFAAYEAMPGWDPSRQEDLLTAHGLLMSGLVEDAGHLRRGGVGIYRGEKLVHMAPPASQLPRLMDELLGWLATANVHPLLASCVVHYELEFIHPFSDGNGRIGRLWQTLILSRWQPLLAYLPVETVIRGRQDEYYRRLGESDAAGECGGFVRFLLEVIDDALQQAIEAETPVETPVQLPERILAVLRERPTMSLVELAAELGKSTSAVERAARKLREAGHLRFVGPKKAGRWEVVGK